MTENTAKHTLRESLSALVDNQATELELHRILKESESNPEIRQTWASYQLASAALKGKTPATEYVDLSSKIRDAIEQEPSLSADEQEQASPKVQTGKTGLWGSVGRFAIAASVAGAVVLGAQQTLLIAGGSEDGSSVVADVSQDDNTTLVNPLQTRTVSTDSAPMRPSQGQPVLFVPKGSEQRVSPEEIQKRLNHLMLEHAEHAAQNSGRGMMPFARIPRVNEE